jgi:hypothetical protein
MSQIERMKVDVINPIEFEGWDDLVLSNPEYSFFHSKAWARVICDSYDYKPFYFALIDGNKLKVLIPIIEISSMLTGKRGVSLPFTDFCQPIISKDINLDDLFAQIINFGKESGWKYIEWRFGRIHIDPIPASKAYFGHELKLCGKEEDVYRKFRSSTKRNIKKAVNEGVKTKLSNSISAVNDFYRLNCLTRKRHGIPPQPYSFFKNLYRHVLSKDKGIIALAYYNNKIVAGNFFLHFGKKAIYKFGASDFNYQRFRANNLVMWQGIKYYVEKGFESLDLGRTEKEHEGLNQFKNGWGVESCELEYYKTTLVGKPLGVDHSGSSCFTSRLFSAMPIPVLKIFGRLVYRHIG